MSVSCCFGTTIFYRLSTKNLFEAKIQLNFDRSDGRKKLEDIKSNSSMYFCLGHDGMAFFYALSLGYVDIVFNPLVLQYFVVFITPFSYEQCTKCKSVGIDGRRKSFLKLII